MKVISLGYCDIFELPREILCPCCRSRFEYDKKDIIKTWIQNQTCNRYEVQCPECKIFISVPSLIKNHEINERYVSQKYKELSDECDQLTKEIRYYNIIRILAWCIILLGIIILCLVIFK